MSIESFYKTLDIKILLKLPVETKNLFLKISEILLIKLYEKNILKQNYGFYGLAYIIKNMLSPNIPKKWDFLYGIRDISLITSKKYGLKVLVLDDSHDWEYNCGKSMNKVSANKFILEQIASSQCFMDLYLEIPYIFGKTGKVMRNYNTYMANLHTDLDNCFKWDKISCEYPHLRSHYVDLRHEDLDYEMGVEYFQFCFEFVFLKFKLPPKKDFKYWVNNTKLKKILSSKDSLIAYIKKIIKNTKIQKQ